MMTTHTTSQLILPVSGSDHVRGPTTATVTLVEYGDYECPYCGEAYSVVEELLATLGDQVRFVFRHFPLSQVHPHAEDAAEAAETAAAQEMFWEMHDTLYRNQNALDRAHLIQYGVALGLDSSTLHRALAESLFSTRVHEDFLSGVRSGVNGTPTFFINRLRHDGSYDLASLMAAIERAVEEQG
jgi:protein-disulfide isomerase